MVTRTMPRVQEVLLPALREALNITVTSWIPDVDKRSYPFVNIRRIGGSAVDVARLDRASLEIASFTRDGLVPTEELYLDTRQVIWGMVQEQRVMPTGYLHSFSESVGPQSIDSPFEDSWRVQGVIQLGLRPPRT